MHWPKKHPSLVRVLCVAILAVFVLAGCGPVEPVEKDPSDPTTPQYGGTIRVALTGYPPVFEPTMGWAMQDVIVFQPVVEGLVAYSEDWEIIPQLAEDYEPNEDYTEWTFKLREGVLFHNGEEMDAEDVQATFHRFLEVSPRASDLADLERVEVHDKYTVKVIMSKPVPLLPTYLAYPSAGILVQPKEILEAAGPTPIPPEQIIGTGPYKLVEAVPDQRIRLERFEDYVPDERYDGPTGFGGLTTAYVDEIIFVPVPEMSSRLAGILAGDYDFVQDLHKGEYDQLVEAAGVEPVLMPAAWIPVMYFNRLRAPFDDVGMRRAVQVTLDHEELMLAAAHSEEFFRLDSSKFTQEQVWHYQMGEEMGLYNVADPDRAAGLLAEYGYDGEPVVILTTTDYDWMYRIAVTAAAQLEAAGFNANIEVYDWPTTLEVRTRGDWDIFVSGDSMAFDPSYFNFWRSDQWLMMPNENLDQVMDEVCSETDFEARFELAKRMQEVFLDEVIEIKIADMHDLNAMLDHIVGFEPYWAIRFWDVWLKE